MSNIINAASYAIPRPIRDAKNVENLPKLAIRLALLAAGTLAIKNFGYRGATLLAGATISLPATLMGVGAAVVYRGIRMISANWSKQAFEGISNGLAMTAADYYILENYKDFQMYSMANSNDGWRKTGRGVIEDFLSGLGGNWVFMD